MQADKVSSGLAHLDAILGGGFVKGRIHLLEGAPGTGKTTLGLQFLMDGRDKDERTLYITLSESKEELSSVARAHGWDLKGIEIFELSPPGDLSGVAGQTVFHSSEVELGEATRELFEAIARVRPARLVLDSLSEMRLLSENPLRYRRQILALKQYLLKNGATVILLDDMTSTDHDLQLHSIVHGVITLEQLAFEYGAERRRLRVTKMRGVKFSGGHHDYSIRTGGIDVYPRLVAIPPKVGFAKEIVRSVSQQLDDVLGGGLRRGTSTLLIGPAGCGKSSVALSYLVAAAERGEHAAMFAFDETAESIVDRSAGIGLGIGPFIESGAIKLSQINPAEMSPGEFTSHVCRAVTEDNARVVVIDSLNGLMNAMPDERHLILQVHELLTFLSQHGVLTLMVIAQHGMVGGPQNPFDLSYISDNVLLLRYFEAMGKIRKAISVMKKRVGSHQDSIRELRISSEGVQVGEPLSEFQGIMTGVPTYAGPQPLLKAAGPQ